MELVPVAGDILRHHRDGAISITLAQRFADGSRPPAESPIALMDGSMLTDPERAHALLDGWLQVARAIVESSLEIPGQPFRVASLEPQMLARRKGLRTATAVARALMATPQLGRYLPVPDIRDARGRTALEVATEILCELPSARGPSVELVWTNAEGALLQPLLARPGLGVSATLRLVVWENDDQHQWIRDIKEQEVRIVGAQAFFQPDRLASYLRGWVAALGEVMQRADTERFDWCMPFDLVFAEVFALRRPRTPDDFRAALLVRSRLGKLAA